MSDLRKKSHSSPKQRHPRHCGHHILQGTVGKPEKGPEREHTGRHCLHLADGQQSPPGNLWMFLLPEFGGGWGPPGGNRTTTTVCHRVLTLEYGPRVSAVLGELPRPGSSRKRGTVPCSPQVPRTGSISALLSGFCSSRDDRPLWRHGALFRLQLYHILCPTGSNKATLTAVRSKRGPPRFSPSLAASWCLTVPPASVQTSGSV